METHRRAARAAMLGVAGRIGTTRAAERLTRRRTLAASSCADLS
jgi:hypothetical protein